MPSKGLPISIAECRLEGMGQTAFGYGDKTLFKDSSAQAFAEAWERLWMKLQMRNPAWTGIKLQNSNGVAAGATAREAESNALSELYERAIFLTAWNSRKGWVPIEASGLRSHILKAAVEGLGWNVDLFSLSETYLGTTLCGLGRRPGGGLLFDSCYHRKGRSIGNCQAKVLRSLLRSALSFGSHPPAYAPLPEEGEPYSHTRFYTDPAHYAAFEFLREPNAAGKMPDLRKYETTKTQVLVEVEGFPSVAVAANSHWPQLSWGKKSLVSGGNRWPHPLA